jgi:phospholipase D1/2
MERVLRTAGSRPSDPDSGNTVLEPGRNVWCVENARQIKFLIDGDQYFQRLEQALRAARKTIHIICWDFDPSIKLRPMDDASECIGDLIRSAVDANPELQVRILVWGLAALYASQSLNIFSKRAWRDHSRIELRLDWKFPVRGSLHQKLVCVDGAVAFAGGIDLTCGRWDRRDHKVDSPLRVKPSGKKYGPVHDIQLMFTGPAAGRIDELISERWRFATGERVETVRSETPEWIRKMPADIEGCEVGIARTDPGLGPRKARREGQQLTQELLRVARRHIYIETQYLADFEVAKTLIQRLGEADGPEIVILVTRTANGVIEHYVMGHNRNRLIRRLKAADRFGRLRVAYAVVPDGEHGEREILLHSKLLVLDDRYVRIGSSNLNYRSGGLDTECDVVIDARAPVHRGAVEKFRNGLLAEHLACGPAEVRDALEQSGSLIAAVDRLNVKARGLRAFPVRARGGKTDSLWGTSLLDPKKPYWPIQKFRARLGALASRLLGGIF